MRNIIILLLLLVLTGKCWTASPEFEAVVNLARQDGQNRKMDPFNQAKNFDPHTVFNNYTNDPDQTKYYEGVQQKDTQQMDNDKNQSKTNETGTFITNSVREHPRYVINQSDPSVQHSQLLQNEAYNIIHGMTSQYIDCKPKEACTIQYEEKQCIEAPQTILPSCKKKLNIEIISHENVTHYPLTAHLSVREHNYAGISMNAVNGRIDFLGPHDADFRLDGRLPGNIDCHTLMGTIIAQAGNGRLDSMAFPSCSNGLGLNIHISGGHNINLQIDMASKVMTYEVKDHWIDDCGSIATDSTCKLKSQQCDIPASTQVIQGVPVTRDCWQHTFNYICRGGSGDGTCKPLQSQGCEQIGSECKEKSNDQCSLYRQTYRCPIQTCSPTTDVICGNGQEYCLDGNCTDKSYQESKDFGKGVSALSGVMDAAKQLDQSSLTIFSGHASECSEKPMGYSNCCTET